VPRDRPADVIPKVFLAIPEEGQTVTSPVRVMVAGEGVVQVMVVSAGTEVAETTIPSYQSGFHERIAEFALDPGTYELRALAPSGEHGSAAQLWDTKTFRVE